MWYFNMLIIMKTTIFLCIITLFVSCNQTYKDGDICDMSISELQDKIKGGWAGQTIGCTYGGHTEFQYNGTIINDYVPIPWTQGYIKWWYDNASGYWKNNPHADDIDYQIEADFAGLMSPCMPNYASEISNKVGHIMNYGNGWYGGVFIGAMYSLAFVSDDVNELVNEALKTIPTQSTFYKCILDVIKWKKKYPTDWKATWFEVERKWTADMSLKDSTCSVVFNGIGFVLYSPNITCNDDNYIAEIEVYIDNKILETVSFPMNFTIRKHEMCWNYDLSKGNHTLTFVWKNPQKDIDCKLTEILIYDNI